MATRMSIFVTAQCMTMSVSRLKISPATRAYWRCGATSAAAWQSRARWTISMKCQRSTAGKARQRASPGNPEAAFNSNRPIASLNSSQSDNKQRVSDLKNLIRTSPDSTEALGALSELYSILRADYRANTLKEKAGFYPFLQQVKSLRTEKKLGSLVQQYMMIWQMLENNYPAAINHARQVLKELQGDDYLATLANLVQLYVNSGQVDKAKDSLAEYQAKYGFDEEGIFVLEDEIRRVTGERTKSAKNEAAFENIAETKISAEPAALALQAHPNPFNPTTKIVYALEHDQNITIRVYDILGREVATLFDGTMAKGTHSLVWDAKDKYGSSVASGVYLIHLRAGKDSKTVKVLFVK